VSGDIGLPPSRPIGHTLDEIPRLIRSDNVPATCDVVASAMFQAARHSLFRPLIQHADALPDGVVAAWAPANGVGKNHTGSLQARAGVKHGSDV
jgi:hypothetical protein